MIRLDHDPAKILSTHCAEDAEQSQDDAGDLPAWILPATHMDQHIDDEQAEGCHVQEHVRESVELGLGATRNSHRPVDKTRECGDRCHHDAGDIGCHSGFEKEGVLIRGLDNVRDQGEV